MEMFLWPEVCTKRVALALAARFLGGVPAQYALLAPMVHAQAPRAPREFRAQSFVLMNDKGEVGGTFSFDEQGRPVIQLFQQGRKVWSAGGNVMRPLGR